MAQSEASFVVVTVLPRHLNPTNQTHFDSNDFSRTTRYRSGCRREGFAVQRVVRKDDGGTFPYPQLTPSLSTHNTFFKHLEIAMTTDISTLAPITAAHSLKRARILYDVNPQAAFIPSVDPNIAVASIARQKRCFQHSTSNTRGTSTSNALAVVSESNAGFPPVSQAVGAKSSTALVITDDAAASNEPNSGGILVVSRSRMEKKLVMVVCLEVRTHTSCLRRIAEIQIGLQT